MTCFGNGIHGQLGGGKGSRTPDGAVGLPGPATAIDAGTDSACAVVNGGVWCWGSNSGGRLGVGDEKAKGGETPLNVVGLPAGAGAIDVAGNSSHYCVLMNNGSVRCWGSNQNGAVGNGATAGNVPAPSVVPLPGPASSVAVSGGHSCATVGPDFYCWGSNSGGQLGGGKIGGESGTPGQGAVASQGDDQGRREGDQGEQYAEAWDLLRVTVELRRLAGVQFDPTVVAALLDELSESGGEGGGSVPRGVEVAG